MSLEKRETLPTVNLSLQGNNLETRSFAGDVQKYLVVQETAAFCLIADLADQIRDSGYQADLIVAITRGGAIPARYLADHLGNLPYVSTAVSSNFKPDGSRYSPVTIQAVPSLRQIEKDLKSVEKLESGKVLKRILVVDELGDHNDTNDKVRADIEKAWRQEQPDLELKVAVVFVKNDSRGFDYRAREIQEEKKPWIVWSWETYETLMSLHVIWEARGVSDDDTITRFREMGFSNHDIEIYFSEYQESQKVKA